MHRRSFLAALAGLPVLGNILQRAPLPTDVPLVNNGLLTPQFHADFSTSYGTITTTDALPVRWYRVYGGSVVGVDAEEEFHPFTVTG